MDIFQKRGNVRLQTFGQLLLRRGGQRGNVPPQMYAYELCFFISLQREEHSTQSHTSSFDMDQKSCPPKIPEVPCLISRVVVPFRLACSVMLLKSGGYTILRPALHVSKRAYDLLISLSYTLGHESAASLRSFVTPLSRLKQSGGQICPGALNGPHARERERERER